MTYSAIRIAAWCAALAIAALLLHAWLASHDEQMRLQATLAAQKQLLDAADARERARENTLRDTLAQIDDLKRTISTPAQILRALPQYLPLPEPIAALPLAMPSTSHPGKGIAPPVEPPPPRASPAPSPPDAPGNAPPAPTPFLPSAPAAQIPASDLKPLWEYVQDCRACQAQLAAARANSADDAQKIAALTRERDAALTAAKGGTFWRRLRRNALWFAIGTGVGAAAYGTTHR